MKLGLERILSAVDAFAEPGEPVGVLIAGRTGRHIVRVIVGGEVIVHAEGATREEAHTKALSEVEDAAENIANLRGTVAIVESASW